MAHATFPPPCAVAAPFPTTTATSPILDVLHWLLLPTPLTEMQLALADPAPLRVAAANPAIVAPTKRPALSRREVKLGIGAAFRCVSPRG